MSTKLAPNHDRKAVDADLARAIYSHPSVVTVAEASRPLDGPADRYLPDRWRWGPVRSSSFDW